VGIYPQALLDYQALRLAPFYAGASVRFDGGWHRVADPARHFLDGIASLANPIGSPLDKVTAAVPACWPDASDAAAACGHARRTAGRRSFQRGA
jgi:hypothetical protein